MEAKRKGNNWAKKKKKKKEFILFGWLVVAALPVLYASVGFWHFWPSYL